MNADDFDLEPEAAGVEEEPVRFECARYELAGAEKATAVVREALLPFVVWSGVHVRVLEPRPIGRMEAFLLEAAIDLGAFELAELADATSVPWRVIQSSAAKLIQRGAFAEAEPGRYLVDAELAARILLDRNIDEEQVRPMTFVYFARQDELLADPEVGPQLARVGGKLRPPRQAPFRPDVRESLKVREFLTERIAQGRVLGATQKLLAVEARGKPPSWPELAPCYFARGLVTGAGEDTVANLLVWGQDKRRRAGQQYQAEPVRMLGPGTLVREWLSLTARFGTEFHGVATGLPNITSPRIEALGPCQFRLGLTREDALEVSKGRWLTEPLPMTMRSSTAKVDVRLSLEPLTAEAANLFVLDVIARRLEEQNRQVSRTAIMEETRRARERYSLASVELVSRSAVEDRLWQMRRFMAVYALREKEDFAYG
jgi:hypothetical protein